jgi:hypothetical protein
MAQTKPKAAQFYGVSGNGTAGQVLISDGNGGMSWGANTEEFTVSWNTPTGQSLTYTQPNPQSSQGPAGSAVPSTTFTVTPPSGEEISGTATIAGLPTGITASQSLSGTSPDNVLTVTLAGVFPGADSLNTALTLSGLTVLPPLTVNYLVVAGGGGGGGSSNQITSSGAAGGGAGGYINSFNNEPSGGTSGSQTALNLVKATNYLITIGGGGAFGAGSSLSSGSAGGGGTSTSPSANGGFAGATNGTQGFAGGTGGGGGNVGGGGGGGAGSIGTNATAWNGSISYAGPGGNGLSSSISGTSVTRGGGGGGGGGKTQAGSQYSPGGAGGTGGAGAGAMPNVATIGTVNTGGGGGGGAAALNGDPLGVGKQGGSGIVILRYPSSYTISGLSGTTTTVGTDKVTTFTTGTGNIQFN